MSFASKTKTLMLLGSLFTCSTLSHADIGLGVAGSAGTTGYGGQLSLALVDESLNLRIPVNSYSDSSKYNSDDLEYDVDVDLEFGALLLDWHPFSGSFYVSIGAYDNGTEIVGSVTPTTNVVVGDNVYTPAQVGKLSVTAEFDNSTAPYVGIGWGNAAKRTSGFLYTVDIGVIDTGDLTTQINSSGTVTQADLDVEASDLNADIDAPDFWPVIAIALGYRF